MRVEVATPSIVCLEIPREVLHGTRMTEDDLRRELALRLYEQGKLSFGKVREMTGLSLWAFQQLLGSQDIPVHYDVADYEQDLATL